MDIQEIRKRGLEQAKNFKTRLTNAQIPLTKDTTVLDFGCGKGAMLLALLQDNIDVYGIDLDLQDRTFYTALAPLSPEFITRWVPYDGFIVPFESQTFDIIHSWFVLEHISNLKLSLKEMVRLLKPGGVVMLYTQDARSAYDGHVKIPWPPFMHTDFYEAYLAEWDKLESLENMKNSVFYVTSDEILCILKYFGMDIISASQPAIFPPTVALNIKSNEDARKAADYFKHMQKIGKWKMPSPQISIVARKQ